MFQSLTYTKYLGYDEKTMLHSYEYDLTDSDFSCFSCVVSGVVFRSAVAVGVGVVFRSVFAVAAVIQEYSKRNLNVAANLLLYFRWSEKQYGYSIADQIEQAEQFQPLFTPQLKADLQKYLLLL
jgi:hypothetical protein